MRVVDPDPDCEQCAGTGVVFDIIFHEDRACGCTIDTESSDMEEDD